MRVLSGSFPSFELRELWQTGYQLTAIYSSEVYRGRSRKAGSIVALKKILVHNEKDGVSASSTHYDSADAKL